MEAFERLVRRLVESFNAAGSDYMFTGALAASYYGKARTTTDVDVVVAVANAAERKKLVRVLREAGLKADERRINDALKSGYRIASFDDSRSPLTVDTIISEKKLKKRAGSILGLATFYQTPEDLILAKLRMIKATVPRERTLKDEEDVKAILKFTIVNLEAVKKRAKSEGTLSVLKDIIA